MPHPEITLATKTIHNPADPRHFMRLLPVKRKVRISRSGQLIAESVNAIRMVEVARDVYDAVTYVPLPDVSGAISPVPDKQTHCPLKGNAHYFSVPDGTVIAWTYDEPLNFAKQLNGLIAFYPDEVTIEEIGAHEG
ncbi:MAG: DUF427 domain-containing protein [Burkholderiaceae bacterium]